ncbi:keratinocyte-associated protein 2-like [Dysidea avara]|uniref:keratinocyte-associated protein 2-like n=1 Tax=Dysidea avara TaxID=196820 RepID=UPI0033301323
MALPTGPSLVCSLALSVLTFAAMQMFSEELAASQLGTIAGGFVGSLLFCFILNAVGNAETLMFEKGFQTKLFPEVIICLLLSMGISAAVHRVCATTCLIFSLVDLYYINRISQATYAGTVTKPVKAPVKTTTGKKSK